MRQDFFDTNVLLYLTDSRENIRLTSRGLIKAGGIVSVQVLNEATRVLRRKFSFTWEQVDGFLASVKAKCEVVPLTLETHENALAYAQRYQLGIYDANIVAAAVLAGCTTLYSEDMRSGMVVDGLTIRNPYA